MDHKTFYDLREKGILTYKDCKAYKETLEDLTDQDNEYHLSMVEIEMLKIKDNIEIMQVEQELLSKERAKRIQPCPRCTLIDSLCGYDLCKECCPLSHCTKHQNIKECLTCAKTSTKLCEYSECDNCCDEIDCKKHGISQ